VPYDRVVTADGTANETDPEVDRIQIARWQRMSPGDRALLADRLSIDVSRLAVAGIRSTEPEASEAGLNRELTRRRYGEAFARLLDHDSHTP
jgi:hypothetical protein